MTILKTTPAPQELVIVPRVLEATEIHITDEGTNETLIKPINPTVDRYFLKFYATYSLKEGGKYSFRVLNGTEEVFLGSIFCTDQDKDNYSINDGVYKESVTDNNLITY